MVKKLSDLNSSLEFVPQPLSAAKAGFIQSYSGTTAPDGWALLSSSAATTITNAQTLYPDLWANSNPAFQSGSDLVFPPQGGGVPSPVIFDTPLISDWNNATGLTLNAISSLRHQIVGDELRILASYYFSGTGTSGSSLEFNFGSLLSGLTINLTGDKFFSASGSYKVGDTGGTLTPYWIGGTNRLQFYQDGTGTLRGTGVSSGTAGEVVAIGFEISVPILEWQDQPVAVVKLYNDASNISMSIADATATKTGAVRLNSGFAAGDGVYGLVQANKFQTKVVGSDVTTDTTFLSFNALTPGKTYKIHSNLTAIVSTSDATVNVFIVHDSSNIAILRATSTASTSALSLSDTIVFVATATTLSLQTNSSSANAYIIADQAANTSRVTIEECYALIETTDFT